MIRVYSKRKIYADDIGLALGGGWARGIIHIQFLKVFDRLGIRPKAIAGTSIGAIIGALYASGFTAEEIEKEFLEQDLRELGHLMDFHINVKYGLIAGKKFEELFRKLICRKKIEDMDISLKIVATDFWGGTEYVFEKGDAAIAVRASISIPGIFDPVKIQNKILMDGGSVNPVPYDIIDDKCRTVVAVDALGKRLSRRREGEYPTVFESIISTFQISQEAIIKEKLEENPPDIYIKPVLGDVEPLDFHHAGDILKHTEDGNAFEKKLKELLNKRVFFRKKY